MKQTLAFGPVTSSSDAGDVFAYMEKRNIGTGMVRRRLFVKVCAGALVIAPNLPLVAVLRKPEFLTGVEFDWLRTEQVVNGGMEPIGVEARMLTPAKRRKHSRLGKRISFQMEGRDLAGNWHDWPKDFGVRLCDEISKRL